MKQKIAEGRILFPKNQDGRPREKKYLSELESATTGFSTILGEEAGYTLHGSREVRDILGGKFFDFPKPASLIRLFIDQIVPPDGIVLDFFAGSGTLAQAVLEENEVDGGDRRFIIVQIPEPTEHKEYPTIAEMAKERVRRVIAHLVKEAGESLDLSGKRKRDRGFRVFKLAESNFKIWDADGAMNAGVLEKQLALHIDHLRDGRTSLDFLYEILLKSGFAVTAPVDKMALAGKTVFGVADGALFVCLEKELTLELIRAMAEKKPERVVCLDGGFAANDQLKTNAVQTFKTKGVVFRTV